MGDGETQEAAIADARAEQEGVSMITLMVFIIADGVGAPATHR